VIDKLNKYTLSGDFINGTTGSSIQTAKVSSPLGLDSSYNWPVPLGQRQL